MLGALGVGAASLLGLELPVLACIVFRHAVDPAYLAHEGIQSKLGITAENFTPINEGAVVITAAPSSGHMGSFCARASRSYVNVTFNNGNDVILSVRLKLGAGGGFENIDEIIHIISEYPSLRRNIKNIISNIVRKPFSNR